MGEPKFKVGDKIILFADREHTLRFNSIIYEISGVHVTAGNFSYCVKENAAYHVAEWAIALVEQKTASKKHERCICSSIELFAAGCTFDKTGVCRSVK